MSKYTRMVSIPLEEWDRLREIEQAIARVRELHQEQETDCSVCKRDDGYGWVKYPCLTIKALDGEQ